MWRDFALCRDLPGDMFFPDDHETPAPAKKVCYQCPVRRPCLVEAMVNGEKWGVWGGLSARERRSLRSRHRLIVLREAS